MPVAILLRNDYILIPKAQDGLIWITFTVNIEMQIPYHFESTALMVGIAKFTSGDVAAMHDMAYTIQA